MTKKSLGSLSQEVGSMLQERVKDYGEPNDSFRKAARIASELLDRNVTAKEVVTIQIALKLTRESIKHKTDNLRDVIGYADILNGL